MSPFATLPDLCLLALFKELPPANLMTARKVCHRWADLVVKNAVMSTRSLAILVGDNSMEHFADSVNEGSLGKIRVVKLLQKEDGSPMFPLARFSQWNALLYRNGLDEVTVEAIAATFANINTLQIVLVRVTSTQVNFISHLLELWRQQRHQLTTLKVCEYLCEEHSAGRLFAAINGLSTLKQLHLEFGDFPYHDLPIISKLEQLRVYWDECSPRQFAALLRQHATANTSLRRLEYLCNRPDSAIEQFTSLSDHLLARFTRFGLPSSRLAALTNSELISTHFRHLTSLNIQSQRTTFRRLLGHLSKLTQLLYLHLYIDFPSLLPDDQPHLLLPQLKSVKALRLSLIIRSHCEMEQLKIHWTMPNLLAIHFSLLPVHQSTDCSITNLKTDLAKHCLRQIIGPLKRSCTQLRAILHDYEYALGTAEEILAE